MKNEIQVPNSIIEKIDHLDVYGKIINWSFENGEIVLIIEMPDKTQYSVIYTELDEEERF